MKTSRIEGFHKLTLDRQIALLKKFAGLSDKEVRTLRLTIDQLQNIDILIENPVGVFPLPLGIATNLRVNARDYLVPMVIEESSVVAALSNGARFFRDDDGITAHCTPPLMVGQIFIPDIDDIMQAVNILYRYESQILDLANTGHNLLRQAGGGAKGIEVKDISGVKGSRCVVVHLIVNVADAMGANIINTMCERVAPFIGRLLGTQPSLMIVSNYADKRVVRVWARTEVSRLGNDGAEVARRIEEISHYAEVDVYRAVTHNKGIMNGIDGVLQATAQDMRANEAAAHAYAASSGRYGPLSHWRVNGRYLTGELEVPIQVGIIGGAVNIHPHARICLKILGVGSSSELARVAAACGLCQNFAALLALATKGIQHGHMRLHAKNLAVSAGAEGAEIEDVADFLVESGSLTPTTAMDILLEFRGTGPLDQGDFEQEVDIEE